MRWERHEDKTELLRKARPTEQTGSVRRKRQYYTKNRKIVSMCEHLRGCSVLERCDPTNSALCPWRCVLRKDREDKRGIHTQTGSGNGKSQSDRGQVIGGKLLIGRAVGCWLPESPGISDTSKSGLCVLVFFTCRDFRSFFCVAVRTARRMWERY